ncbi:MAG: hemerythrin family protein [Deltaproteobacteria bacterium]|jgi:hemerythrin|nr:hemerythrin family protein [Deltaproteobacteria bacterium]
MKQNLLIVWNDINIVGIPIIDEQHRGIVSVINSLHFALNGPRAEDFLEPVTKMLRAYTIVHFDTETDILEAAEYPDLENHRRQHEKLVSDTDRYALSSLKNEDSRIMISFLKDWWTTHINKEDMLYKDHLAKNYRG